VSKPEFVSLQPSPAPTNPPSTNPHAPTNSRDGSANKSTPSPSHTHTGTSNNPNYTNYVNTTTTSNGNHALHRSSSSCARPQSARPAPASPYGHHHPPTAAASYSAAASSNTAPPTEAQTMGSCYPGGQPSSSAHKQSSSTPQQDAPTLPASSHPTTAGASHNYSNTARLEQWVQGGPPAAASAAAAPSADQTSNAVQTGTTSPQAVPPPLPATGQTQSHSNTDTSRHRKASPDLQPTPLGPRGSQVEVRS